MDLLLLGQETGFTLLLLFIGFIIVIIAQIRVTTTYNKYQKQQTSKNLTGFDVARKILDENNMQDIHVVETKGHLTDHYDPGRKVVRLSTEVYHNTSISSVAVAAHEVGHAIQHKTGYVFMNIRSFFAPVVSIVTYIGYFVSIISLFAGITGYLKIGIFLILVAILFQLVTLPVELNASKRAKKELLRLKLIDNNEISGIASMLAAAAMTYIASLVSSIINLLRLVIMLKDDN